MEAFFHKIPPQSIEAEQSVLGSILINNDTLVKIIDIITPDDFYREAHRILYRAILDLYEKKEPADLVTVTNYLKEKDELKEVGGASYISELVDMVPTAANVEHYARIIKEKSMLRSTISAATDIISQGMENPDDVDEFLDKAENLIFQVAEKRARKSFFRIKGLIDEAFERVEKIYNKKTKVVGISTGFTDFDRLTGGLQHGDMIIIAGRPSMGKTSLALNIANHVAADEGMPVAIFSLEMSRDSLAMRMLLSEAKVSWDSIRRGDISDIDMQKIIQAANNLLDAQIYVDDTPNITTFELRSKARRLQAETGLGLIVVDYLQLMRAQPSHGRLESREREISEISRSLKGIAKELNVPVVVLSQLNRAPESRQDKRPLLADLRESGAIEQDADLVCLIYRPEVYEMKTIDVNGKKIPTDGIAEINVAKHRNGPTGKFLLTFLKRYARFEDYIESEMAQDLPID